MGVRGVLIFLLVVGALGAAAYYAYSEGMLDPYLDAYLPLPDGWVKCEGTCTVPLQQEMRLYSKDLTRKYQVVFPKATGTSTSVQFTCAKTSFGTLASTAPVGSKCAYRPINTTADLSGYTLCGVEGATCSVPLDSQVRMFAQAAGTSTSIQPRVNYTVAYPTSNVTPFECGVTKFPFDPANGKVKICYYTSNTTAT